MAAEPEITVCMPTRNAGEQFARTLEMLRRQKIAQDFELVALDSGSSDGTLERLEDAEVRVLHIDPAEFDWGRARSMLLEASSGVAAVQLSQDAVPAREDWLDAITRPLFETDAAVVCGSSIPDPDRSFSQFQWEKNGYYYFTREMAKFRSKYGKGLSFANAAIRLSDWREIGLGDQTTGEDFQYQMRLHAAGKQIVFTDDAPVLHHHNYSLRGVALRCRNEGLALRGFGCPYNELDLVSDLLRPAKNLQWLREASRGTLRSPGEWFYPVLRPIAVYAGSRFGREYIWY